MAVLFDNSPLLSPEMRIFSQALRHFSVLGLACASVIYFRRSFSSSRLNVSWWFILSGSCIAILVVITKILFGLDMHPLSMYQAVEPLIVISAAIAISSRVEGARHALLIIMATLLIGISALTVLHIIGGENVVSLEYNRPRLTLGFIHPGKFAQHITLIFLVMLYFVKPSSFLFVLIRRVFLIGLVLIVLETSTRAMLVVIFIVMLFLFISRFNQQGVKFMFLLLGVLGVIGAVFLVVAVDRDYITYLVSGRLVWWATAIMNNIDQHGYGIFLYGVLGQIVSNRSGDLGLTGNSVTNSVRFDNGYLEIVLQSGAFVLIFYLLATLNLGISKQNNKKNVFDRLSLISVLIFFNIGESGFLAVGNSFGLVVIIMLLTLVRAQSRLVNSPFRSRDRGVDASSHVRI